MKLAQLTRRNGRPELIRSAVAPRNVAWQTGELIAEQASSLKEIEAIQAISGDTFVKKAACTLSMSSCDLVPGRMATALAGAPAETAACSGEWMAERSAREENWYTFSAAADVADVLCGDVRAAGMSCRVLDALPHALARAVMLAAPAPGVTLAALDCGHTGTTFAVVREGMPLYVRQFKGNGVAQVEEQLCDELSIGRIDTLKLFSRRTGTTHIEGQKEGENLESETAASPINALVEELASPYQESLAEELLRTLTHLRSHKRSLVPQKLILMGGGALLDVADRLGEVAELPTLAWQMPTDSGETSSTTQPLFGVAAGLSALTWEAK